MFTNSNDEILSSAWAISEKHANAWLLMVAQILQGKIQAQQTGPSPKEAQKEMRGYIVDHLGELIDRSQHSHTPQGSIGVVMISGPMIKYGTYYAWGSDELVAFAQAFERDPNIVGQIWLMDSGGGSVNAIAPYLEFLKKKTKPVLALADTCASANIYVAVGADKLFARNNISAMFGSIGVMATIMDFTEYLKNLGVNEHLIYATQSSYKHRSYNKALNGDYKEFRKEHLDPIAIQFQNFVQSSRPKLKTDVEGILEGKMFYADEAQQHGLIDGIIDFEEAVDQVKFLAGARTYMFNN